MDQGQTSFRNDFEREFWARAYAAIVKVCGLRSEHALRELRNRQQPRPVSWADVAPLGSSPAVSRTPGSWRGKEDTVEDQNERLLDELALSLGDRAMCTPGVGQSLANCLNNPNPINERGLLTSIIRGLCDDIRKIQEASR